MLPFGFFISYSSRRVKYDDPPLFKLDSRCFLKIVGPATVLRPSTISTRIVTRAEVFTSLGTSKCSALTLIKVFFFFLTEVFFEEL
jgi:hypothetical protein